MTQAVTETDATVDQSVEEEGAQDLDSLLNEFEEEVQPKKSEQSKVKAEDVNEAINYINQQRLNDAKTAEKNDIKSAVDSIKSSMEGMDNIPSDRLIRGLLQDYAAENENVRKAFANRQQNPKAWQAAIKAASKEIKEEFSVDTQTTSDREAITSAVRSASSKQPEPQEKVDYSSMSDYEFQQFKMKVLRGG